MMMMMMMMMMIMMYSYTRNVNTVTGFPPHLYCCEGLLCCDYTYLHCSLDWKGDGWYRFIGEAGEKMPDSPPGYRSGSTEN